MARKRELTRAELAPVTMVLIQKLYNAATSHPFLKTSIGKRFFDEMINTNSTKTVKLPSFTAIMKGVNYINQRVIVSISIVSEALLSLNQEPCNTALVNAVCKWVMEGIDHLFSGMWTELADTTRFQWSKERKGGDLKTALDAFVMWMDKLKSSSDALSAGVAEGLNRTICSAVRFYNYPEAWGAILENYATSHVPKLLEAHAMLSKRA